MHMNRTRRDFLKTGSLAAAALALKSRAVLADAAGSPAGPSRRIGIAVVGLGNFADIALPRIASSRRARITALVSRDGDKAKRYASIHGIDRQHLYTYDDFDRIAMDDTVDLVYLTLPVGLHAEFAIRAMKLGKHVLSEKTLAASVAQGEAMLAVARETGRHLMIAYRTCFGPAYAAVSALIEGGEHGRVVHVDAHKGFPISVPGDNWRFDRRLSGGGSLVDVGVYSIQAARMFGGGMPVEVSAQASSPRDRRFREVEDTIAFTLRFPNGVLASGSSSWSYRLQNRLRVGLERAWVDLEPASPLLNQVLTITTIEGGHAGESRPLPQQDQLPLMFDHMAEVIIDGLPSKVPAADGLSDLYIIDAIHRAVSGTGVATVQARQAGMAPDAAARV